ncbi:dephospho-CoA kinase [Tissierella sp. MSJ-40]|uniref:Dephospho-CoA kinase n=1 Tax=Tissierella simiarum TaxID=2841534 RepID=A0ABS6EBA6_9FIRM|nr:dephospho-CoA kinase [Tissierella simiarum]MBU5440044.1 dephospho-CoA kinase [Tissierella simiarum]
MKQNKCLLIGLTGGISTGKSTVSNILKGKGYKVIDADEIAKEVVEVSMPAYEEIVDYFGEDILLMDKTIDRKKLGKLIFNNINLREKLNGIVHPYVFRAIKENINYYCEKEKLVFLDIPLLFEQIELLKKHSIIFHEIWLVYTDEETQIERLMKRDIIDRQEAIAKIKAQMSIEEKKNRSSRIIDNSGIIEELYEQIDKLLEELI